MIWPVLLLASGVIAAAIYKTGPSNTLRMKASDGKEYDMQDLPDKDKAVELMAAIHAALQKLKTYYEETPGLKEDPPVGRFLARFQSDVFVENNMESKDTSYSENKGEKIVVCLRDKNKAPEYPLIDKNTVMFVILHEMAHLMTETIGHTQEFWNNFRRILHDAVQIGIYSPVNYAHSPADYCGMRITDTPI